MAADQLSKFNPDGTLLGQSGNGPNGLPDKIAFFGKTAHVKITGPVSIGTTRTTAIIISRLNTLTNALKAYGLLA